MAAAQLRLGLGEPSRGAEPPVRVTGVAQQCLAVAAERGGKQPGWVGMAAGEGHQRAVDAAGGAERFEVGEELGTQRVVVKCYGRHGQLADEDRPEVGAVGSPCAQVGDDGHVLPGAVKVAGPGEEPGGDRMGVDRRAGPVGHRVGGEGGQFLGDGACPGQLEAL